ncbi:glycosyl hydrolase family 8 [Cupriavidus basilensis]|uniref:glycosyl hydrolase family 8 n=1 Tax=Cupriavidus basilensis TaxID=68895 RepID=UPI003D342BF1
MAGMQVRLTRWLFAGAMAAATVASGAATCPWPDWKDFRRNTISAEGRVVDASSEQRVTVSEGQAYGLFFALVAGPARAANRRDDGENLHLPLSPWPCERLP